VLYGLRRTAFTDEKKALSSLSHWHGIVSYVSTTPRSKISSSKVRGFDWKWKYHRTAELMTSAGGTMTVIERFSIFQRAILTDGSRNLTTPNYGVCLRSCVLPFKR
jgi:hypothetical protein